ncbi:MAG: hypothetical protein PGN11_15130 [Quadrisphaera sp.]
MHPATPLPSALARRPFHVAEALRLGVTRKRLRSPDLWAPFTGVRVPVALGWDAPLRARAGLLVCPPGTCVAGLDAVGAAGLPLPWGSGFDDLGGLSTRPLLVSPPPGRLRPWEHEGFAVDLLRMPFAVPRVAEDGVLRAADPDLWARTVASPSLPLTPRRLRSYGVALGLAVAERDGGTPLREVSDAFRAAVDRLPEGLRHRGLDLLGVLLPLLREDARASVADAPAGRDRRR